MIFEKKNKKITEWLVKRLARFLLWLIVEQGQDGRFEWQPSQIEKLRRTARNSKTEPILVNFHK